MRRWRKAADRLYSLLNAGVRIYEYRGGLLHAKTLTVDSELALVGSANMDRRSFELNYENNVLFWDPQLATDVREWQQSLIESSRPVDLAQVEGWSVGRRLWTNTVAMLSPLL